MVIVFFKATREPDQEPTTDKMRRILESDVEEAETSEDRERAERDLRNFVEA